MYIIIDDRDTVAGGYATGFDREGVSSAGIEAAEFREWIGKVSDADMHAVEAFVIGDCRESTLTEIMQRKQDVQASAFLGYAICAKCTDFELSSMRL